MIDNIIDNIIQILLQMELEKDRPLYLYEIREVLINNIPEVPKEKYPS